MTVLWAKYRGPGDGDVQRAAVAHRRRQVLHASASFSEPGEYVLQAVVDDGSGESAGNFGYHCCWTNAQVKITVKGDEPRARGGRVSGTGHVHPGCRADLPGEVPDLPSPGDVRADVARDLRRSAAVGALDSVARRQPGDAALAPRQDRRHSRVQERPLAQRRRDRDHRALGGKRRAAGQSGRHAEAVDVPAGGGVVHRRARPEGHDRQGLRDVPERTGLVDRSVRRGDADRGSLDQGDGDQAEQSEDRPSRRGLCDRAGCARGHTGDGRPAPRVRGREIRRHLRREHRPVAEGGHAAAIRHALLRGRLGAAQQDDDRVQVLSEGRDAEIPGAGRCRFGTPPTTSSRFRPIPSSGRTATSVCRGTRASTRSSRTCTCAAAP